MPQFNGKQEATRNTRCANLRCPRNGQRSDFAVAAISRFRHIEATGFCASKQRAREGGESAPASPDTGQQGGDARAKNVHRRDAPYPAGKPGRARTCRRHSAMKKLKASAAALAMLP